MGPRPSYGQAREHSVRAVGTHYSKPEPSFVLTGEMTFEQANEVSKLFGFVFAQDATVAAQPWFEPTDDQLPAVLISGSKKMTDEQVRALHEAASAAGLDYSTTVDGKGAKFLHFGDADQFHELVGKVRQIAAAAGLNEVTPYYVRSNLNAAEDYVEGGLRSVLQGTRDRDGAEGPSDLFRRTVDSLLVPYAKAVGSEGYRFSPERFGRIADGIADNKEEEALKRISPA